MKENIHCCAYHQMIIWAVQRCSAGGLVGTYGPLHFILRRCIWISNSLLPWPLHCIYNKTGPTSILIILIIIYFHLIQGRLPLTGLPKGVSRRTGWTWDGTRKQRAGRERKQMKSSEIYSLTFVIMNNFTKEWSFQLDFNWDEILNLGSVPSSILGSCFLIISRVWSPSWAGCHHLISS